MNWLKYWFVAMLGVTMGAILTLCCVSSYNTYAIEKDRVMTSYEYTTDCRCGGTIEGYQSLVDGYNREECKSCGYHKE